MKVYVGVEIEIYISLTSALAGGEWSASRPDWFTPWEKAPVTHWKVGCVDTTTDLNEVEKRKYLTLPGHELWILSRSARS
jgi:hypothetical protein